ncbi:MAG: hypothetical protein IT477_10285, partial [Rhodanobacteraceae bacterium]|nr:hypothetical protein [Rhodanobacteraceae bacterium]
PEHTAVGEIYVPSGGAILQIGSDSTLRINVANNGLYGDVAPAILGHNASLRRNSATTITKNGTAITWPAGGANVTDGVLPLAATAAVNAWNGAGNYNTENYLIETQSLAQTYIQA